MNLAPSRPKEEKNGTQVPTQSVSWTCHRPLGGGTEAPPTGRKTHAPNEGGEEERNAIPGTISIPAMLVNMLVAAVDSPIWSEWDRDTPGGA